MPIQCSGCGNANGQELTITEDGRYVKCSRCGAVSSLYQKFEVHEVIDPTHQTKQHKTANAHHLIGLGQYATAESQFRELSNQYAEDWQPWYGLARALSQDFSTTKEYDESLKALANAQRAKNLTTGAQARIQGGLVLLQQQKALEEAEKDVADYPINQQNRQNQYERAFQDEVQAYAKLQQACEIEKTRKRTLRSSSFWRHFWMLPFALLFLFLKQDEYTLPVIRYAGMGISVFVIVRSLIVIVRNRPGIKAAGQKRRQYETEMEQSTQRTKQLEEDHRRTTSEESERIRQLQANLPKLRKELAKVRQAYQTPKPQKAP